MAEIIKRPVDEEFISAMEEKLEYGREKGRTGWDTSWESTTFDVEVFQGLVEKFYEEVDEVFLGLANGKLEEVAEECVDVANLSMMLWDFINQSERK